MKSYNNDETLSGGSACRWYLNEDIPEIDDCFERLGDDFQKVQWISNGAEKFAAKRNRADLPQRSVDELRNMDPWETENTDFLCTVTITKVMPEQPWWFQSCSKCHRFRLCLEGTDGTGTTEFVFFNRVAQQLVGKSVMALLRSSGLPREIATIVSQKYTLAVSVTQKSLSQRNISFQVNGIETFFGRQNSVPHDTRASTVMPLAAPAGSSTDHAPALPNNPSSGEGIPELPIETDKEIKKSSTSRVPLRLLKRKKTDASAEVELSSKVTENGASSDGTIVLPITPPITTTLKSWKTSHLVHYLFGKHQQILFRFHNYVASGTSTEQTTPPKKSKIDKTVVTASDPPKKPKKGDNGSKTK
ncbi:uncharacterized protein [Triticum aestivum]|uniref:uncharacterized protein isoform X4 n=1 Tax=Triticum aestivum TaxID=4565 RepID=UPI001D017CAE|nr:uncharacterized protein LOC123086917 isoform X4 [Triticum aestivum]